MNLLRSTSLLAAAAAMLGASAAHAASVSFSTASTTVWSDLPGFSESLAFTGVGTTTLTDPNPTHTWTGVNFGSLQANFGLGLLVNDFDGKTLSINVTQSVPNSGNGSFTATLDGTFHLIAPDTLELDWTSSTFTIPDLTDGLSTTYTLSVANPLTFVQGSNTKASVLGTVSLDAIQGGSANPAPLPASFFGGLSLLTLTAGASLLRRRKLATA